MAVESDSDRRLALVFFYMDHYSDAFALTFSRDDPPEGAVERLRALADTEPVRRMDHLLAIWARACDERGLEALVRERAARQ